MGTWQLIVIWAECMLCYGLGLYIGSRGTDKGPKL